MPIQERHFEGAVAVLDVIGFRARMMDLSSDVVCEHVLGTLHAAFQWARRRFRDDLRRTPSSEPESLFFADTLALLLPRQSGTIHATEALLVQSMVFICQLLMAAGMVHAVPLRGAISYGEGIVCSSPPFYIGRPFLEAHTLEASQNWAGVSLCESARQYVKRDDVRTVEWPVPIKADDSRELLSDGNIRRLRAVDWPPVVRASNARPDWAQCFPGYDTDPKAQAKFENTRRFFERNSDTWPEGLPSPFEDWRKDWRKRCEKP